MVRSNRDQEHALLAQGGHDGHVRVRRRGTNLEDAILEAAWEELTAVGYAHFTIDAVAARAHTSKPVLYRRWPSRPALVLAAIRHHAPLLSDPVPDTGSLRGDVLALLHRYTTRLTEVGLQVRLDLLADHFRDTELSAYVQTQLLQIDSAVMMPILERAAERGEVELETIPPRVATLPLDLLRLEILVTHAPPTETAILEVVDDIFMPLVHTISPRDAQRAC
jgi:AcrR family transcriptional regulator